MEQDEAPKGQPRTPKTPSAAAAGPTEEELSRRSREPHAGQPRVRAAAIGPELEKLHVDVKRLERMTWGLVVVTVVLVLAVVYLLIR